MKQNAVIKNVSLSKGEIDLTKNKIVVIKDGQAIEVDPPDSGYGNQVVIWLGGKVDRVESMESKKL